MDYVTIAPLLVNPKARVAGLKQAQRAVEQGMAQFVVLARDADEPIARAVKAFCAEHAAPCVAGPDKAALGAACRLQVATAVAVVLKGYSVPEGLRGFE